MLPCFNATLIVVSLAPLFSVALTHLTPDSDSDMGRANEDQTVLSSCAIVFAFSHSLQSISTMTATAAAGLSIASAPASPHFVYSQSIANSYPYPCRMSVCVCVCVLHVSIDRRCGKSQKPRRISMTNNLPWPPQPQLQLQLQFTMQFSHCSV